MSERQKRGASHGPESGQVPDQLRRRRPIEAGESPSEAVVDAVATADDVDADALPPLHQHVAADCLDDLIGTRSQPTTGGPVFTRTEDIPTDLEVSFRYAGHEVTVSNNYVVLE